MIGFVVIDDRVRRYKIVKTFLASLKKGPKVLSLSKCGEIITSSKPALLIGPEKKSGFEMWLSVSLKGE
ncbi:MAG: hypothetical protein ACPGWR_00945 [Ardenticatenaceae bacterium]